MADESLRSLERRAAQGDPEASTKLLVYRLRSGELSMSRLQAAVWLNSPEAIHAAKSLGLPHEPAELIRTGSVSWRQPISEQVIAALSITEVVGLALELLEHLNFPVSLIARLDAVLSPEGLINIQQAFIQNNADDFAARTLAEEIIHEHPGPTNFGIPSYQLLVSVLQYFQDGKSWEQEPDVAANMYMAFIDALNTVPFAEREPHREWLRNRIIEVLLNPPRLAPRRNPDVAVLRSQRQPFLSMEQADRVINEQALPIFHNFRYRRSDFKMYRRGSADEFSEFTFDPNYYFRNTLLKAPAQMTGQRDTGLATGQYSFCSPQSNTIEISGPAHPFMVTFKSPSVTNPASHFSKLLRTLLRAATTLAGIHDYSELLSWGGDFPIRELSPEGMFWIAMRLAEHRNGKWFPSLEVLQKEIFKAVVDWNIYRHVHPANILLSRFGFDGIWWGPQTIEWGDCGDYGCLKFPPISYEGEVIGLNPVPGSRIYMVLP